jgi:hypothetical protein
MVCPVTLVVMMVGALFGLRQLMIGFETGGSQTLSTGARPGLAATGPSQAVSASTMDPVKPVHLGPHLSAGRAVMNGLTVTARGHQMQSPQFAQMLRRAAGDNGTISARSPTDFHPQQRAHHDRALRFAIEVKVAATLSALASGGRIVSSWRQVYVLDALEIAQTLHNDTQSARIEMAISGFFESVHVVSDALWCRGLTALILPKSGARRKSKAVRT